MANFNKVILLGNLTRDIELRYTQSGLAIAKVGMAINRRYTSNGEQKEDTCFVDLTAFGRQAETLEKYVGKGSPLFVDGRLEFSTWEGQDGAKRSKLAVVIENFQFVGSRGGESKGAGRQASLRQGDRGAETERGGGAERAVGGDESIDYGDVPF